MVPNSDLNNRIDGAERLLKIFLPERIVYIVVSGLAIILLFISAVSLLKTTGKIDIVVISGLFGSSGAITLAIGRTLKMWNDVVKMVNTKEKTK